MNAKLPMPARKLETAAERWARFQPITTGEEYLESLRGRPIRLFLFGKEEPNPVDNPLIRPSMNALARSYDLALEDPDLATAHSPFVGKRVNRFLHIVESPQDLVTKNLMQRRMGQLTGTCFQRCAGLDTISGMHSITYDIDQEHGTPYHARFLDF
ncbi:MAG: 4-hydroxybutyryl-CoA dehydratase, partial [Polyangiaceae bacterium]|nr:4-hydroxybutyryl-CoA dehydratase [Polyangiaceae bacterium]